MGDSPRISKDESNRFHPELDFERVRALYRWMYSPETRGYSRADRDPEIEACFAERIRVLDKLETRGVEAPPNTIATDLFVWAHGEAPDRAMTKQGGVPFWPAEKRWPRNWLGRPLSYLGQINFRDSRDIVGNLPGELLVMFVDKFDRVFSYWLRGDESPLIEPAAIPRQRRTFDLSYGVIHRTYDRPGESISQLAGARPGCIASIFDVKIGGVPWGLNPGSRFVVQFSAPWETYDGSGTVGGSFVETAAPKGFDPFAHETELDDDDNVTLNWWAATLKRNGNVRWTWA